MASKRASSHRTASSLNNYIIKKLLLFYVGVGDEYHPVAWLLTNASDWFVFEGVESVPVMTSLKSSQTTVQHLNDLLTLARRLDIGRLHKVTAAGLEVDEYHEVLEGLQTVVGCYETQDVDML